MEKIWLTPEDSEEETSDESPPWSDPPQVMTEPSSFRAAKAVEVEKILLTPEDSEEDTEDELPPLSVDPQVMTEPSFFRAAKAY